MSRTAYDLSHLSHNAGHIGRLQTVCTIPVEAGCSLELDLDGIARLAPTRKEIVSECQIDICAFFVPHRIVYGQDWINFLKAGPNETETFTGIAVAAAYRDAAYLTLNTTGATVPRALVEGYNRIWYNYYSIPSFEDNRDNAVFNNDYTWFPTNETGAANCRKYGRLCARLPHVLNGGNQIFAVGGDDWLTQGLTAGDQEVPVSGGVFTLEDLAQVQSRYKTEAQAAWFSHFYQDVMKERWGTDVGPDTDPTNLRPHYLGRKTLMMSGTDIDGTDDATLGTFQGKTMERVNFQMPRKFFNEQGVVWVMALFRYPLVHNREQHALWNSVNWDYDKITGDPERYANLQPVEWDPGPWLAGGASYSGGGANTIMEPYGQHYRFQNNRVHPNFLEIPGYPFSNFDGSNMQDWYYHADEEYRPTFQTTQIGQWQLQSQIRCTKYSQIPGVAASIFAGT